MERILVVDDENIVRRFAVRILAGEGYQVIEAKDGQEALDVLASSADLDLVVSDVVMPRLNGIELVERLSVMRPQLPVLLMSGYGTAQLADRGVAAPCAILPKPFPPQRLVEEVRRCLPSRV